MEAGTAREVVRREGRQSRTDSTETSHEERVLRGEESSGGSER